MWISIGIAIGMILLGAFGYGAWEGFKQAKAENQQDKAKDDAVAEMQSKVAAFLAQRKALIQPAIPVAISDTVSTDLTQSRLGGKPAWPNGEPYPTAKGKFPLCFLAQINLADMPALDGFPTQGLLQFYFAADDVYGMVFPDGQSDGSQLDSDILVVLHETLDDMHLWSQFESDEQSYKLDVPFTYDDWWKTGYVMTFEPVRDMKPTYDNFQTYDAYIEISKLLPNEEQFRKYTTKWAEGEPLSTVIGGHPHFTQMDPRYYDDKAKDFTKTLISIPSVQGKIMWGDVGTGSFMIRPEDLRARDFTRILYNYDCY